MYVKIFSTFTGDLVKTKKKNNLNLYFITHRIFFIFYFKEYAKLSYGFMKLLPTTIDNKMTLSFLCIK